MRKRLCLLLIFWLPCFVMAANVMSLQMTLAQQAFASAAQAPQAEMPCHPVSASQHDTHHAPAKHHCTVCGFCMVSSGAAHLDTFPRVSLIAQSTAAPVFLAAPVHTQTYPPAIKPPIFS